MRIEERLGLAHLVYRSAVVRARVDATPASWRRLVAAARNLRVAKRDRGRGGRARGAAAGPAVPAGLLVELRPPPLLRTEPEQERDRARRLILQSRELILQARALRGEIDELLRACRRTLESIRRG